MPSGTFRKSRWTEIKGDISADDVNLLGDNMDIVKKSTGTLIYSSIEVDLEVNTEKTKYILLSRHQNEREIMT
jgi:hypothetical protein